MSNFVPKDLQGVYSDDTTVYRGKAIGGPEDGREMSYTSLTKFIPRSLPKSLNYYQPLHMSPSETEAFRERERLIMEETLKARQTPHRYDFDVDEGVWRYIEYAPPEL